MICPIKTQLSCRLICEFYKSFYFTRKFKRSKVIAKKARRIYMRVYVWQKLKNKHWELPHHFYGNEKKNPEFAEFVAKQFGIKVKQQNVYGCVRAIIFARSRMNKCVSMLDIGSMQWEEIKLLRTEITKPATAKWREKVNFARSNHLVAISYGAKWMWRPRMVEPLSDLKWWLWTVHIENHIVIWLISDYAISLDVKRSLSACAQAHPYHRAYHIVSWS